MKVTSRLLKRATLVVVIVVVATTMLSAFWAIYYQWDGASPGTAGIAGGNVFYCLGDPVNRGFGPGPGVWCDYRYPTFSNALLLLNATGDECDSGFAVPFWVLGALMVIGWVALVVGHHRFERRGACRSCGYRVQNLSKCPECGKSATSAKRERAYVWRMLW